MDCLGRVGLDRDWGHDDGLNCGELHVLAVGV